MQFYSFDSEGFPHYSVLFTSCLEPHVGNPLSSWNRQPAIGTTSGTINWQNISNMDHDILKCCSQRLLVKCLSITTSQNALLRLLSQTHGLLHMRAVTWRLSSIRWASFWPRLLLFRTTVINCEIKITVRWANFNSLFQSSLHLTDLRMWYMVRKLWYTQN